MCWLSFGILTGSSFNATWSIDGNLVPLRDEFVPQGRNPEQKGLMVHIDNANPILHK
jgi:hypothetical protein